MKRHVVSTKDSTMDVKKENIEVEEVKTKKRLKTSHADRENSVSSDKLSGNVEDVFNETNGDSIAMNLQFSGAETSTPIAAQNGAAAHDKASTKNSDAFTICTAIPKDKSNSNDSNGIPSPINGIAMYEDETVEMNCHDEVMKMLNVEDEDEERNEIVGNNCHDEEATMPLLSPEEPQKPPSEDIDVENDFPTEEEEHQRNTLDYSFKYDIDSFTNSSLEVVQLDGHAHEILSVVADGDIILSAGVDTTVKLWDPISKKEVLNFQGHTAPVTSLALLTPEQSNAISSKLNFFEVSRIVISASVDCSVRMWSVDSGDELSSFYTYNGITCLAYLEDSHHIAIGTDGGKLEIWDLISSTIVHTVLAHEEGITSLKTEDCYIYTTSTDGKIKVWCLEDNECYAIYTRRRMQCSKGDSELKPAQWCSIACSDHMVYLGDDTSNIKVLDWRKGNIKLLKNQRQTKGKIDDIVVKEDILLSLYYDAVYDTSGINVWKLPRMKYVCTISGADGKLSSLAMTVTDDKILRIVSGGKNLLVWNFITAKSPSKESDAKYYCQKVKNLGDEVEEIEESGKPLTVTKDDDSNKEETEMKPSTWSCSIM